MEALQLNPRPLQRSCCLGCPGSKLTTQRQVLAQIGVWETHLECWVMSFFFFFLAPVIYTTGRLAFPVTAARLKCPQSFLSTLVFSWSALQSFSAPSLSLQKNTFVVMWLSLFFYISIFEKVCKNPAEVLIQLLLSNSDSAVITKCTFHLCRLSPSFPPPLILELTSKQRVTALPDANSPHEREFVWGESIGGSWRSLSGRTPLSLLRQLRQSIPKLLVSRDF